MDQIYIKTPNPKCRLFWSLIEFIDWRYSQSCWYFRPHLWTSAPLTFSLVHLPPFPVWISTGLFIQCVKGGGGGSGPQTDKHRPPSTVPLLVKKPIFRIWYIYRYLVHVSTNVNEGRQCACLDTASHSCRASPPASQSDAQLPRLFSAGPVAIIRYR